MVPDDVLAPLTPDFFFNLRVTRYCVVAGWTLVIYDFLMTVPDEITLMWPARRSWVKFLFVFLRYGSVISLSVICAQYLGLWFSEDRHFCLTFFLAFCMYIYLSFASLHAIMLMRTYVVWDRQPAVLYFMILFKLGVSIAIAGILVASLVQMGWNAYPLASEVQSCYGHMTSYIWVLWVPSFIAEWLVFIGTFATFRHHSYTFKSDSVASNLVRILFRDAAFYLLIIIFTHTFNIYTMKVYANDPRNVAGITFTTCLANVVGQRLVMDLRRVDDTVEYQSTRLGFSAAQRIGGITTGRPLSPIMFEMGAIKADSEADESAGGADTVGVESDRDEYLEADIELERRRR